MSNQIVLASNNQGKLREIDQILKNKGIDLLPQSKFNVLEVEETGKTFIENAILKARAAASHSGLPAIADDSGIEVDILKGKPGIYSARYAGDNATDEENLNLLIQDVIANGVSQPVARYQCVIVFMRHAMDPMPIIAEGSWEGYIVTEPKGEYGFGYDPIFYVPTHNCTSAELMPEIKNKISHRGIALQKLSGLLLNQSQ
ncbi:MAG: RdgB/HAM1 family non-canonical purine NTP pyrophosphatase [Gammaproteobacteria bacterium]|jgi:XTP/dITP diphosphohydrolase